MYGIRVFDLRVTEGPTGRTPLDFAAPFGQGSMKVIDHLAEIGKELVGPRAYTSVPALHDPTWTAPDAPSQRDPQLYFTNTSVTANGALLVQYKHGYFGEYEEARGATGVLDLSGHSPVRDYRALIVPPTVGHEGRLVVEAIGRRCPVTPLIGWLGWQSRELATATGSRWIRLKATQMADREHLKRMVRNASRVTTELIEMKPDRPGERRGAKARLVVDATYRKDGLAATALDLLDGGDDGEFVVKVAQISGYDPEELDRAGLRIDDAMILVQESRDSETKRISPETIREKFTYPVSSVPISNDEWIQAAVSRLRGTLVQGTEIII
jgi:hypothetical protein